MKGPEHIVVSGSLPPEPNNATMAFYQGSTGISILRMIVDIDSSGKNN